MMLVVSKDHVIQQGEGVLNVERERERERERDCFTSEHKLSLRSNL